MSPTRAFREDDAPGRIPESLIDSVLDGAVDERTRREVARALRHDPRRRLEVSETIEAIGALREPVPCPDFSGGVLVTLDRKHRFVPARVRRTIRRTRMAAGGLAALALLGVAVAQRQMPRLASLGAQPTPVTDVARAVGTDATEAAGQFRSGVSRSVRVMQASLPPLAGGMTAPGRTAEMDREIREAGEAEMRGRFRLVTIEGGRYFMLVDAPDARSTAGAGRGGLVSSITTPRPGDAAPEDERGNELLP